jgi:hypothetical protein
MLDIVKNSQNHNGNGSVTISGRGVLRRKLTPGMRANLAADIATGLAQLTPSLKQTAAALGVSPYSVRQQLKARAKKQAAFEARQQEALAIVSAWDAATPQGRTDAIRLIGVADVWDVLASVVG